MRKIVIISAAYLITVSQAIVKTRDGPLDFKDNEYNVDNGEYKNSSKLEMVFVECFANIKIYNYKSLEKTIIFTETITERQSLV